MMSHVRSMAYSIAPPVLWQLIGWLDPEVRSQQREINRLRELSRYEPTSTTLFDGQPMEIVDAGSFLLMYDDIIRQQTYRFVSENQSPKIIDGGANVGLSVLFFKRLYPNSHITAFEPDPTLFQVLTRNVKSRGLDGVDLHCEALWSSASMMPFSAEGSDAGRLATGARACDVVVKAVRLRDHLSRRIELLKLDIEGAETEVLIDCADRLEFVERVFVEYHSFKGKPQSLSLLLNVLSQAGYRISIRTVRASARPFLEEDIYLGMDLQLNIFAWRESKSGASETC